MKSTCRKHLSAIGFVLALGVPCAQQVFGAEEPVGKKIASPGRGKRIFGGTRIPTLVMTKASTLLAFCSPKDNHPGSFRVRRSEDNGKSWGKTIRISTDGGALRVEFGEPSVIADQTNGTVWAFFNRGTKKHQSPATALLFTYSEDDGRTWNEPVSAVHDPERFGAGKEYTKAISWQGKGIQLSSGRLLTPCMRIDKGRQTACLYSDDHGKTWRVSEPVTGRLGQEICLLEMTDGIVYMNARKRSGDMRGASRWVSRSSDGGKTWSTAQPEKQLRGAECHAGLIRLTDARKHDRNRWLFSLPSGSPQNRYDLRIFLSYDEGKTWKWEDSTILINGSAAYSDMVLLPDMSIGVLYETNKPKWHSVYFTTFTLEWLTAGKDRIEVKK
jgi:sialidase-1